MILKESILNKEIKWIIKLSEKFSLIRKIIHPEVLDKLAMRLVGDGDMIRLDDTWYMTVRSTEGSTICFSTNWNKNSGNLMCHIRKDELDWSCKYSEDCYEKNMKDKDNVGYIYLSIERLVDVEVSMGVSIFKSKLLAKNYGRYLP